MLKQPIKIVFTINETQHSANVQMMLDHLDSLTRIDMANTGVAEVYEIKIYKTENKRRNTEFRNHFNRFWNIFKALGPLLPGVVALDKVLSKHQI